ncbi:cytoplasmic polyadenylation element-binding protein [Patella vulgata]|uniref:cytoplasmic polyadenylation element-binding protein n=1 Tax=Patella vulgata TaxID=6465 RepID=UPI0024A9C60B|nr:cytoplasmic polyadenylation element-binding protein [Patella vulgata]
MSASTSGSAEIPAIKVENVDSNQGSQAYPSNVDILKRINALLGDTLDLASTRVSGAEQTRASKHVHFNMSQMPDVKEDNVQGMAHMYNQPNPELQSVLNYAGVGIPSSSSPTPSTPSSYNSQGFHLFSPNGSPSEQWANMCHTPDIHSFTTPTKYPRAIKGERSMSCTSSDYGSLSPVSPMSDTSLSPVEKIIYSSLLNNRTTRSPSPCESDTSGFGSEGSDAAALNEMMNNLSLSNNGMRGNASVLHNQHQQQQHQQLTQQYNQQYNQQQQDISTQLSTQLSSQLCQYQPQQTHLMRNSTALSNLTAMGIGAVGSVTQDMNLLQDRSWQTFNPFLMTNVDPYAIDRAARLHRNAASVSEASCTWSGQLPPRSYKNPTYSCKVFLGGVPWDITEPGLQAAFSKFGSLKIEWPGKDGYVYLLFDCEKCIRTIV